MVPPRGRIPLTSLRVRGRDFSGQIRPSKPSGMPMTCQRYLRMADLTAARMTEFRPGASPPPVQMPIRRMSDIVVRYCAICVTVTGVALIVVVLIYLAENADVAPGLAVSV